MVAARRFKTVLIATKASNKQKKVTTKRLNTFPQAGTQMEEQVQAAFTYT